jgi:hypothetical protein
MEMVPDLTPGPHFSEEVAREVVFMPSSRSDDHGAARFEAITNRALIPLPQRFSRGLGLGDCDGADWIVDNDQVGSVTCRRAADTDREVSTKTTCDVPRPDGGFITGYGHVWEGPPGIENLVPNSAGECVGEVGRMADLHDPFVGISTEKESRKLFGDVDRLRMPWRHGDNQPIIRSLDRSFEGGVEDVDVRRANIVSIRPHIERAKALSRSEGEPFVLRPLRNEHHCGADVTERKRRGRGGADST